MYTFMGKPNCKKIHYAPRVYYIVMPILINY